MKTDIIFVEMIVLVWCHGGCFGGGQASYDAHLRAVIQSHGCLVHSVHFTKSYDQAIKDINEVVTNYGLQGYRVILGGISSGGLLAHQVANERHLPALLIAPVLAPYTRHYAPDVLTHAQRKLQLSFFGNMDVMLHAERIALKKPNSNRCVIYGKGDCRAPEIHFSRWAAARDKDIRLFEISASHSQLCQNPPTDIVLSWLSDMDPYLNQVKNE